MKLDLTGKERYTPPGKARLASLLMMTHTQTTLLMSFKVPLAFVILICALRREFGNEAVLDSAEYFAGHKSVTLGMRSFGMQSADFEINDHYRAKDMLGPLGFLVALRYALALRRLGMMWLAPVCSTWTWCNRHTSGRSLANPLGFDSRICVQEGNTMVFRSFLLAVVAVVLQASVHLEQPSGSLMDRHPAFVWFVAIMKLLRGRAFKRYQTWMGMFGARTPKNTIIYSTNAYAKLLYRKLDKKKKFPGSRLVCKHYVDKKGKKRMTGGVGMKNTQHYPPDFGKRVGELHSAYMQRQPTSVCMRVSKPVLDDPPFDWAKGADLDYIVRRLGVSDAFIAQVEEAYNLALA